MENPWSLLSTAEAAKQLGVSEQAIRRYFHSGILRGRTHGRFLLIDQRAVLSLMKVMQQCRGEAKLPPVRKKATPAALPCDENMGEGIILHEPGADAAAI